MTTDAQEVQAPPILRRRVVRRVGMLSLNNPPSNALTPQLRLALWDRLAGLEANRIVDAVVIMADGRMFSSGVEVPLPWPEPTPDVGSAAATPSLAELCARIEACAKPVIVALQGPAVAGGAELALAAHYRLAAPRVTIGLPEIALGLVPGGGATQRLPRLIGADPALRMLLTGKSVTAETARDLGLIDGLVSGEIASAAHAFALSLLDKGQGPRPTGALRGKLADAAGAMQAAATARAALHPRALLAAGRIVDCIEAAALLPFDAGLDFEAVAHEDSLTDPQSRALRHLFAAERRISSGLLAPDGKGGRSPTGPGRAVLAELLAAHDAALGWIVSHGTSEATVDATWLDWGFARAPFGTQGAGAPAPQVRLRVAAAMAAAGARMLAEGRVARPGDIDALAVHGLGFPRRWGGPMRMADAEGLPRLLARMRGWAEEDPVWSAPPLMVRAGREAAGFAALERSAARVD